MNTSDHPRTASTRHNEPSIGSDRGGRSALREDLDAVWAISAGLRLNTLTMPVPILIRSVEQASWVQMVKASQP